MSLSKNKKIFISLFLMIIIIGVAVLYNHYWRNKTELSQRQPKIITEFTTLYSQFTPNMKNQVDSYVKAGLQCEPEGYYYNNESVCFICSDIIPCFYYQMVNVGEPEEKMNFQEVVLTGSFSKETELTFYSQGIFKLLNCQCAEKCFCEEEIEAELLEKEVTFIFLGTHQNAKDKLAELSNKTGQGECKFTEIEEQVFAGFECGNWFGVLIGNRVIFNTKLVL